MTVMDMKTGFVEKIGGTTQEEIVKALIAREAMALKDADIG
mgnify:CR=1 FL=1